MIQATLSGTDTVAVRFTFTNNTTLELDSAKIRTVSLMENSSETTSFTVGATPSTVLTLVIDNTSGEYTEYNFEYASIEFSIINNEKTYKKGRFDVWEVSGDSVITLICYDSMRRTEVVYETELSFPTTLGNILLELTQLCGVKLTSDYLSYPNIYMPISNKPSVTNCRQLLIYIAQCIGGFFYFDAEDDLKLNYYKMSDFNNAATFHVIDGLKTKTIARNNVIISGINVIYTKETLRSGDTTNSVLSVEDNPLIDEYNAALVLASLTERFVGLSFRPLNISCMPNFTYELGDAIVVNDKGIEIKSFITQHSYSANISSVIECANYDNDTFKNPYAKLLKLVSDTAKASTEEIKEVSDNAANMAANAQESADSAQKAIEEMMLVNLIKGENGWIDLGTATFDFGEGSLVFDGKNLSVIGKISASSGNFGDWLISDDAGIYTSKTFEYPDEKYKELAYLNSTDMYFGFETRDIDAHDYSAPKKANYFYLNPGGILGDGGVLRTRGIDIDIEIPWKKLTLASEFTQGNFERSALSYKKIGNHVYISGSVIISGTFTSSIQVTTLPSNCKPSLNQYKLVACSGARIARIFVNSSGELKLEWIKLLSSGSSDTTTENMWIDITMDYWID